MNCDPDDVPLGADLTPSHWLCEYCGEQNSDLDGECQYCDGDKQPEGGASATELSEDSAWQSESRLRDLEGHGDYEGPRNWP
jgi:hypothetical protein